MVRSGLRLVTDRDAGWVRDIRGLHVVDVDGPVALLEVTDADGDAVRRGCSPPASSAARSASSPEVRTPLSEIYREVTA